MEDMAAQLIPKDMAVADYPGIHGVTTESKDKKKKTKKTQLPNALSDFEKSVDPKSEQPIPPYTCRRCGRELKNLLQFFLCVFNLCRKRRSCHK